MKALKWLKKYGVIFALVAGVIVVVCLYFHSVHNGEVLELSQEVQYTSDNDGTENSEQGLDVNDVTEEDVNCMFPEVENELFLEAEKKQIENDVLAAANSVWELYDGLTITQGSSYASCIEDFSKEQRIAVVAELGENGNVATTNGADMVNGELLKSFYKEYQSSREGIITIYDVDSDGLISSVTFLCRNGEIQTYYVGVKPDEDGNPCLIGKIVQEIDFINLTPKGYFIYAEKYPMAYAGICNYWRVEPLPDECRELTEHYLSHLDFQKYNLMVIDWNKNNVSDVLMPGLFEDLYYIKNGESYKGSNDSIPGDVFEEIMMAYLPVSVTQLREFYTYDEENKTYAQETIYNSPYPPFLEVMDYKHNSDGTITLYADGVWPDYNSDYAFTNVINIKPHSDGTFMILSNDVEEKELKLPPIAYKKGDW